ncbi:MAG TPA: SDR family NAD(P)-dependent oxidoreductase [Ktedonobacterales bacterium]|nr:SDR family NAD(P)-dependent oxidoreductase [Ktedonobacterales bacterium]
MGRLDGKVAIVTGGGSGLGRAITLRYAREGARVLAADINEAGARETARLAAEIGEDAGERVAARALDVTDEDGVAAAVEEAVKRWGRLDIMMANAGIGWPGPIALLDLENWERVLRVNLTGVFLSAKHAFRAMRKNESGGVILATASVAGLEGTPGLGAYGPAKAGVIQLVKTLALEGARYNIRANAICPVWIDTPMVQAFVTLMPGGPELGMERLRQSVPLGRVGAPEDVAAVAAFLASDDAAFMTGTAVPVDGGHTAGASAGLG